MRRAAGALPCYGQRLPDHRTDPLPPELATAASTPMPEPSSEVLQALLLNKLDEDKAEDVVCIDLQGKSPIADAVFAATGRSARHVAALSDHLLRTLKDNGFGRAQVEGLPAADWVLIDAGDVIVHLFRPEVRAFYQIEKIWSVDSPHRTPAAV
ncbi:ribosome silencing factor [soil metagenome]